MKKLLALCVASFIALSVVPVLAESANKAVEYSGDGASIQYDITIPFSPARIILTSTGKNSNIDIKLSAGWRTHKFKTDSTLVDFLDNSGEYDLFAEGTGKWTLRVEPIGNNGTISVKGKGPYVGSFFNFTEPTIVVITYKAGRVNGLLSNFIVRLNHQGRYLGGWTSDGLANKLLVSNDSERMEKIIQPTKGREEYFWSILCDPEVSWEITVK